MLKGFELVPQHCQCGALPAAPLPRFMRRDLLRCESTLSRESDHYAPARGLLMRAASSL